MLVHRKRGEFKMLQNIFPVLSFQGNSFLHELKQTHRSRNRNSNFLALNIIIYYNCSLDCFYGFRSCGHVSEYSENFVCFLFFIFFVFLSKREVLGKKS